MKRSNSIITCPQCGKDFKSLGFARHRAKHRDDFYKEIKAKEKEIAEGKTIDIDEAFKIN